MHPHQQKLPGLRGHHGGNGLRGDDLTPTHGTITFKRCRLDTNTTGIDPKVRRYCGLHVFFPLSESDGIAHNGAIYVTDLVAAIENHTANRIQKLDPGITLVPAVRFGKKLADITQPDGTQQRVTNGVTDNIGVGVPFEPHVVTIEPNTPQPKLPILNKRMHIPANTGSDHLQSP
jgi:hypothetical protein